MQLPCLRGGLTSSIHSASRFLLNTTIGEGTFNKSLVPIRPAHYPKDDPHERAACPETDRRGDRCPDRGKSVRGRPRPIVGRRGDRVHQASERNSLPGSIGG